MKEHDIAYQELERIDGSINSEHRRVVNLLISLGAQDIVTGNCKRMSRHLALFTRNTTSAIPYLLETKDPVCINRSGHTIVAIHHPPSNQVLAYDGTAAQVVSFNHLPQSALVQFGPFSTFTDLFSNLGRSYIHCASDGIPRPSSWKPTRFMPDPGDYPQRYVDLMLGRISIE